MAAGWKRILTTEDGNIGTSNLTIDGNLRSLNLGNAAGVGVFAIADNNSNGILTVSHDQTPNEATVTIAGLGRFVQDAGGNQASLRLFEGNVSSNYVEIKAPTLSGNYTLTLPTTDGDANQVLKTDGSGNLSWVDQSSGSGTIDGSGAADRMAYWSDADTLTYNDKFEVDDSTGQVTLGALVAQTTKGTGAVTGDSGNFFRIIVGAATGSTIGDTGGGSRFFSKFGTGTVTAGKVHYKTSTNTWATAANDDLTEASSLLAVADSTASSQIMLKEGAVKMASNQGFSTASRGAPLYLASVGGAVTSTVPAAGSNPVYVRIVGYVIDASNAIIYFDPDKSWVEI